MLPTLKLSEMNENLTCPLCKGYLIDACTIVECLHSFCKSCIVRFLDTSYNCPVCHTEVHKTKPLVNVRPDPTLQDIVYKMVPNLYDNERLNRKSFQASLAEGEEGRNVDGVANIADNSDAVYVTLDHHQRNVLKVNQKKVLPTRYLRCSKHVPIRVLKKLIQMKFQVKKTYSVEISRCDEVLSENLSLQEISRIYGLHGKTGPIDLKFDVISQQNPDVHISDINTQTNTELRPVIPESMTVGKSNGQNYASTSRIS
ncbi:polycomb complex protein BMI-1-like [Dendronephthya gigantea]|uniref:polycomb complex protein BMI-1-like n=1 Tax=Dendronephthya gigantea TaxID=151771 RepID=UPI00106B8B39|nr:polycomb complex protein BMI-1-like [Dendronephthya gigantea]